MEGSVKSADPRLVKAKEEVLSAKAHLEEVMEEVQKDCPHYFVAHHAITSSGYCSDPRRICYKCRLEEVGTHWSYTASGHWSQRDGEPATLGEHEERVVVDLSKDSSSFYGLRRII